MTSSLLPLTNSRKKCSIFISTLQDVNVAISRAKKKLIILGNFDMMLNGWTPSSAIYRYKSSVRSLARLVDSRYGKVIDVPTILIQRFKCNVLVHKSVHENNLFDLGRYGK
jgi:hypothetical protein